MHHQTINNLEDRATCLFVLTTNNLLSKILQPAQELIEELVSRIVTKTPEEVSTIAIIAIFGFDLYKMTKNLESHQFILKNAHVLGSMSKSMNTFDQEKLKWLYSEMVELCRKYKELLPYFQKEGLEAAYRIDDRCKNLSIEDLGVDNSETRRTLDWIGRNLRHYRRRLEQGSQSMIELFIKMQTTSKDNYEIFCKIARQIKARLQN